MALNSMMENILRSGGVDRNAPPDPVWGSPEWNATNDPQHARDIAWFQSPEFQRWYEAQIQSQHDLSQPAGSSRYWEYPAAIIGGAAALGGNAAAGAGEGAVGATEAGTAAGGPGAGTGASAGLPAITEGGGAVSGSTLAGGAGSGSTLAGGAGATGSALEAGGGGAGGSAGTGALEGGGTSPVNAGPGGATDVGASPFDNIDYGSLLRGLPGAIGAIGAHQQTQAYRDLANRYLEMGQPYRDRLAALYADPTSFLHSAEVTTPVQQGTDALARSLSVQGNPIGSGHALQELQNYSANQLFGRLGEEKNRLAGFGGLASYNAAAPGAAGTAVGSQGNIWNALGSGVGAVVNPQPTLIDLYRSMQGLQ